MNLCYLCSKTVSSQRHKERGAHASCLKQLEIKELIPLQEEAKGQTYWTDKDVRFARRKGVIILT